MSAQFAAEHAKRETEERLRLVLDAAPGGFYAVDREGNTNLVSRGFLNMLGFKDEQEALGRKLHDVIHHTKPDGTHYPVEECPIYRCAMTGQPAHVTEESFFRLDGAAVPVEYWATPICRNGEQIGASCTVIDLRERKQADAALREESRTLETLNRTGSAIAAELDLGRLVQMVTDAGVELTGAQFGAFFYNVLDQAGEKYLLYALSGAERADFDRFGMPRATAIFHPTFMGEGVVRSDDITKDERYGKNDPHRGMPDGHLPVRSYLAVPVISRSGEVIGGLFFGHPGVGQFTERHDRLITGIAAQAAVGIDNARLYDAAQKELAERMRAQTALRELNETLEQRVQEEVGRRAQAEEALRQAQKMEAVGQLTGGIAHDFNNLLTGVIGSLDMMQRQISKGETGKIDRYATTAMTAANRAAALTHRLLAFSRRQPLHPKPVDANRLVTGMEELLRRTIGESIALEIVTAGGLWQTLCDPHQLESAVLNLAINARDAMPDGGTLTIETCNTRLDSSYAADQRDVQPGQYICICVTDTGSGMSKETMEKAFEPFFTTKPIGQGTGLGLSMIYGFTRQSDGYARIYSELGSGSTIKLYLPRYYGEADGVEEQQGQLTDAHRAAAGEVVLVIEDETTVRELVVDVLGEMGYRAIEAADGPSGLKLLQSGMHLDLLITDIGLPGLNGRQVVDAARPQRPDLKVLFMTGYAENATIANGFLEPGMEMITKPFAIETLATRIRDMIGG
ncbi:MAG TPA: response regulator [Sphingomicrobium sp.]|nr:response regulator [Sphingomicrobium sp.]